MRIHNVSSIVSCARLSDTHLQESYFIFFSGGLPIIFDFNKIPVKVIEVQVNNRHVECQNNNEQIKVSLTLITRMTKEVPLLKVIPFNTRKKKKSSR